MNAQGDVVGIFDGSGNCVVTYNWDNAWGYNPAPEGSMADTLGTLNPLRYRSYVYDDETGLYYLQSRYYDPEICRFINADAYTATGQGLLGNNMFAYCRNNPVTRVDAQGTFDKEAFDIDGDPTGDEKDVITSASTGFVKADVTIYRYGGTNPSNLTPRYADVNSGLSFSTEYRSGSAKTTISAINSSGILFARQDGRTHVSVTPTNASMLAWYEAGSNSEWTLTLKSIVEKVK